jgi:quercetin dioxygenase-like cupin family protein
MSAFIECWIDLKGSIRRKRDELKTRQSIWLQLQPKGTGRPAGAGTCGNSDKEDPMNEQATTPKGKAFNLENHIEYAAGSVVSKTLIKQDTGTITLFAFDRGQGLSEHTAPFDAVVQVIDGTADITIGGRPQIVNTGEMLIMPANITHALQARERFKMLLVMIRSQ